MKTEKVGYQTHFFFGIIMESIFLRVGLHG